MRILQVCKKFPWPPRDGESIAILNLSRGFALSGHEVTVLAMNTPKHRYDPGFLPDEAKAIARFYAIDVDTRIKPFSAFFNLFTRNSYNLERFYSEDFKEGLYGLIRDQSFDLIQLEGLYLAPYFNTIRRATNAPVVMRSHNVEFEIWEKLAKGERRMLRRHYMKLLASLLKRFETETLNAFAALVPISPADETRFRALGATLPIHTCTASISTSSYLGYHDRAEVDTIGYLGALDWVPNREGVDWFLQYCLPTLRARNPKLKVRIAGRNAPSHWIGRQIDGVEFLGEVEDAKAFLSRQQVIILPLLSGSGMRIKMLEALAIGRPTVATAQAAEGIEVEHGRQALIADSPEDFVEGILALLQDSIKAESIGKEGQRLVNAQYDQEKVVYELLNFYTSQLFL